MLFKMASTTRKCDYCLKELYPTTEASSYLHDACELTIRNLMKAELPIIKKIEEYLRSPITIFFTDRPHDFSYYGFYVVLDRTTLTVKEIAIDESFNETDEEIDYNYNTHPIMSQVKELMHVEKIILDQFTDLGQLPLELATLPLKSLSVSYATYTLPKDFALPFLEDLELYIVNPYPLLSVCNNRLKSLAITKQDNFSFASLDQFLELEKLTLNRTNLTHLPAWFSKLQKLEYLDLSANTGIDLSELHDLPLLKTLKLGLNNLKSLPLSLNTLTSLEYLDMHDNYLLDIPDFKYFPNLKTLAIDFYDKYQVTKLCNMPNIEKLYLLSPRVNLIPDSFKDMQRLEKLSINIEQENLPAYIYHLPEIKNINIITEKELTDSNSTLTEETIYGHNSKEDESSPFLEYDFF